MHRMLRTGIVVLALLCFASRSDAQEEPPSAEKRSRPREATLMPELATFLTRWSKKAVFEKDKLTEPFMISLTLVAEGKPEEWLKARQAVWKGLPNVIRPERQIAGSGTAFLAAMSIENMRSFYASVEDLEVRQQFVDAKLYLILALAQDLARRLQDEEIEASHMYVAVSQAWTGLWPFCPTKSASLGDEAPAKND